MQVANFKISVRDQFIFGGGGGAHTVLVRFSRIPPALKTSVMNDEQPPKKKKKKNIARICQEFARICQKFTRIPTSVTFFLGGGGTVPPAPLVSYAYEEEYQTPSHS